MGKTHVVIGVSYGVTLLPSINTGVFTLPQVGIIICGLTIGSLLPDIDHPQSIISRQIPLIGMIISKLTRHRGLFHSLLGVGLMFLLLIVPTGMVVQATGTRLAYFGAAGLMIGYILHIVADMLTVGGVKLFYPWQRKIAIGLFTTGGLREAALRWFLVGVSLIQITSMFIK